jgi:hypothetical protein
MFLSIVLLGSHEKALTAHLCGCRQIVVTTADGKKTVTLKGKEAREVLRFVRVEKIHWNEVGATDRMARIRFGSAEPLGVHSQDEPTDSCLSGLAGGPTIYLRWGFDKALLQLTGTLASENDRPGK